MANNYYALLCSVQYICVFSILYVCGIIITVLLIVFHTIGLDFYFSADAS